MEPRTAGKEVRREVRFAVVMYGGVSLAIYINGVVQELFKMVKATATRDDDSPLVPYEKLRGTECVYRQLGQMLGRDEEEKDKPYNLQDPIRTRFVVDVLSGTSAGGINAVYLAKALANGQEIDQLSDLWVDEGDIGKLINDKASVKQLDGLKNQKPPRSLLNGQRMYRKLLDAFDGMEKEKPGVIKPEDSFVEELDLFVTATDFHGLPIPLRLADKVVDELLHRNVYHLRYKLVDEVNDFVGENNPFLAFAARSTSAFPFAFDPIKLSDMDAVLKTAPTYRNLREEERNPERWKKFFPTYQHRSDLPDRAFVDGGYLDNKPFGYATEVLVSRRSALPIDRKLIYIEPTPEHLEDRGQAGEVPNAVENVAAAFSLARYETIREDLQRILYRNRLIERVETITSKMEEDVSRGKVRDKPFKDENFGECDLTKMIDTEGVAYGGYHRLKIGAVCDEITEMIARSGGFALDSDEFLAIRFLVRAWKEENYVAYLDGNKATENEFLMQYDLSYRLRRLNFVLYRIDRLYSLDKDTRETLSNRGVTIPATEEEAFRAELTELRAKLNEVFIALHRTSEELKRPGPENPLVRAVGDTKLTKPELRRLLKKPAQERRDEARQLVRSQEKRQAFRDLASELTDYIGTRTNYAAARCEEILGTQDPVQEQPVIAAARDAVRNYYDSYDRYDLISFPILYATEVGEEIDPVEVVRISPEDAELLEKRRLGVRKLAGTAFRGFGAFLDRGWRHNDILWGRLDGAERIITTLLYGSGWTPEEKEKLIQKAQLAILVEEVGSQDQDRLSQLLVDAMAREDPTDRNEAALRELAERELGSPTNPKLQAVLRQSLREETLLDFYGKSYEVNRELNRKTTVQTLARSTRVTGNMFEGIAGEQGRGSALAAWLARIGRMFSGLAEISVRGSIPNLIWRHWLVLLYVIEVVLILVGAVFSSDQVYRAGLAAVGATALVHIGTLALNDYMRRTKRWWLGVSFVALVAVILLLAALGIYHLISYTPDALRDALAALF